MQEAAEELRRLHSENVQNAVDFVEHQRELSRALDQRDDLLVALRSVHRWMDDQADGQSKGGHATFDLMMLREQRDIARAAIAKATGENT